MKGVIIKLLYEIMTSSKYTESQKDYIYTFMDWLSNQD